MSKENRSGGTGHCNPDPAVSFNNLKDVVDRLRSPGGCPWDREQTPMSIRQYLLEEAHELVEAIESGDPGHLCEELGDVMFQVLFLSRMAQEYGWFEVTEVMDRIAEKLVRRHPTSLATQGLTTPPPWKEAGSSLKPLRKGKHANRWGKASP